MPIIDPHVHVWKNDPAFPWPAENKNPPAEDRTAEMLLENMAANGVEKTVLVQVIHYRWDNSYIAHVIQQYPDKFMAVGRVNPEDPANADHLSMWTEEHGLHGVRRGAVRRRLPGGGGVDRRVGQHGHAEQRRLGAVERGRAAAGRRP